MSELTNAIDTDVEILLAQPRGFCAGVDRAIEIVERALKLYGAPIYVRHEIVHNAYVVADLRRKGAIFVEELDEVPAGSTVIFSAHGVSREIRTEAGARGLNVFDATCPLVTKVHVEVSRMRAEGCEIIMIGHAGHPEVEGTMGQADTGILLVESAEDVANIQVANPEQLGYVTQTTLSVDDTRDIIDALKARFPTIKGPDVNDICYATQNRQQAVRELVREVDVLLVIGAKNSSNSNRLREIGTELSVPSYLIDDASALKPEWLTGAKTVGITAGASAPEALVEELVAKLKSLGYDTVTALKGLVENVRFKLPPEVRETERARA
jgi:4-hydroxy-3-methylbut-2-enyl diphosphate reductase